MSTVGHTMKLLEGAVVLPNADAEIESLHQELSELRRELSVARREAQDAKRETVQALGALRKQLNPLYRNSRVAAVWDNWKAKMGSSAKIIEALQLHGELNTQQLAVTTGYHRATIPAMIFKLNKHGLINKNAGKFSLKQL